MGTNGSQRRELTASGPLGSRARATAKRILDREARRLLADELNADATQTTTGADNQQATHRVPQAIPTAPGPGSRVRMTL